MISSRLMMLFYIVYWIFLGVIVVRLERKIGALERENTELREALQWHKRRRSPVK